MNFFFERLKDILPAWWSISGRLIYSITGGGLVAYLAKTLGLSLTYATSIALATVPILAFWLWWESRLPKGDLNKANIAIAIATETELERQLVRRDLVEAFNAQLQQDPNARLNTFLIPPHHCIDIGDLEKANRLRASARAHFLIWGDLRTRREKERDTYVLMLHGVVAHRPIERSLSAEFSGQMRSLIPASVRIDCGNDLSGFEILSEDFSLAATYIIAVAAMLSADFVYAESLLRKLWHRASLQPGFSDPHRQELIKLTKQRLINCLAILSRIGHARWRLSRNREDLEKSESYLEAYRDLQGSEDPDYWVSKAIGDVVLRHDVVNATRRLKACASANTNDPVSRYGLAFLHAVEGELDEAYRSYRDAIAKDQHVQSTSLTGEPTAFEVEEFIEWYLNAHPTCVQLHFCLGFLNMERKKDYQSAKKDFEKFLAITTPGEFKNSQEAARKYLKCIEARASPQTSHVPFDALGV